MSGGSFDYFSSRAPEELRSMASKLESMADYCDQGSTRPPEEYWRTGEMLDLATLVEVGAYLRLMAFRVRGTAKMLEAWEKVTHDVEWWASGDSGPGDVIDAFRKLVPTPAGSADTQHKREGNG